MNPYVTGPDEIPSSDPYVKEPLYGRYCPKQDDFRVDTRHINSTSEESLEYWSSLLAQCTESNRIYPADEHGRDVFALGAVIVKSGHLHKEPEIDYTYADANEVEATAIAKSALTEAKVPHIHFSGKVNGRQLLIQERLPGVGLNVALPYLTDHQKESFKSQARAVLRRLHAIQPSNMCRHPSYVMPDPNILTNGHIRPYEAEILFLQKEDDEDQDLGFMHNDFSESNCIVNDDKIVGLVDWEMAGYFGWKKAAEVHRRIRTPQREHFTHANVSEERIRYILWWNDLYDV